MKHDYIVLIVGKSGSGKSTICNYLEENYGVKELRSYTTRPKRNTNENSHIFINDEEFDNLIGVVAPTKYNDHRYCATEKQVEECDTYIIDPDGVDYFLKEYTGSKIPMIVYISTPKSVREKRMYGRGHSEDMVNARLEIDDKKFANVSDYATYTYRNENNDLRYIVAIGEDIYARFFKEGGLV